MRRSEIEPRSASASRSVSNASARLWPWKLPAEITSGVVEHERVVGDRVEVGDDELGEEAKALAGGAVHLGGAAQRVGVLQPARARARRAPPAIRPEPVSAAAMLAALRALAGQRAQRVHARIERRQGSAQRVDRGRGDERRSRPAAGRPGPPRSAPTALMKWVPLISARPSLLSSSSGSEPSARSASAPVDDVAVGVERMSPRRAAAGTRARSGARSPLAPSEPVRGTQRDVAAVEQLRDPLEHDRAHAGVAEQQPVERTAIAARTTSGGSSAPVPAAWLRSRLTWRWRCSSGATVLETSAPKPVLIPYTAVPVLRIRSSVARLAAHALQRGGVEPDPGAGADRRDVARLTARRRGSPASVDRVSDMRRRG